MTSDITRRQLVQTAGTAGLLRTPIAAAETPAMRNEASDTPKICLELSAGRIAGAVPAISSSGQFSATTIDDAGLRHVKQLGVNYVLGGGGCRLRVQRRL